jgi:hypothetical protein
MIFHHCAWVEQWCSWERSHTDAASAYAGRREDWQGGQELNFLRAAALVASMNAPKSTLALVANPIT